MIAANYRKHPEALALQLPLPFPHRLKWATARPGRRILRAIRAERLALMQQIGRIVYITKATIPQWWKEAKNRARDLARTVRDACKPLLAEIRIATTHTDTALIGWNYETDIETADARAKRPRIAKRACMNCGATTTQRLTFLENCRCLTCGCRSTIGPDCDPDDRDAAYETAHPDIDEPGRQRLIDLDRQDDEDEAEWENPDA